MRTLYFDCFNGASGDMILGALIDAGVPLDGVRQALGADQRSILRLVLKQGMVTAGIGIVLGLAGSWGLSRLMQTMLFGVSSHDASVYAAVSALLLIVAITACYIPARRATRVDPIVALRES